MGKLEIGLYDVFTQATMAQAATPADVYDEHIRTAQGGSSPLNRGEVGLCST